MSFFFRYTSSKGNSVSNSKLLKSQTAFLHSFKEYTASLHISLRQRHTVTERLCLFGTRHLILNDGLGSLLSFCWGWVTGTKHSIYCSMGHSTSRSQRHSLHHGSSQTSHHSTTGSRVSGWRGSCVRRRRWRRGRTLSTRETPALACRPGSWARGGCAIQKQSKNKKSQL